MTLRPGGVIVLGGGDMQLFDELKRPLSFSSTDACWVQRVFFAAYNAMRNWGGSINSPTMSPT
jgi:hypothetical protein